MNFVSAQDLQLSVSSFWKDLEWEREIVITVNGQPAAIVSATNSESFETRVRSIRNASVQTAIAAVQKRSVETKKSGMTQEELAAEIREARLARH